MYFDLPSVEKPSNADNTASDSITSSDRSPSDTIYVDKPMTAVFLPTPVALLVVILEGNVEENVAEQALTGVFDFFLTFSGIEDNASESSPSSNPLAAGNAIGSLPLWPIIGTAAVQPSSNGSKAPPFVEFADHVSEILEQFIPSLSLHISISSKKKAPTSKDLDKNTSLRRLSLYSDKQAAVSPSNSTLAKDIDVTSEEITENVNPLPPLSAPPLPLSPLFPPLLLSLMSYLAPSWDKVRGESDNAASVATLQSKQKSSFFSQFFEQAGANLPSFHASVPQLPLPLVFSLATASMNVPAIHSKHLVRNNSGSVTSISSHISAGAPNTIAASHNNKDTSKNTPYFEGLAPQLPSNDSTSCQTELTFHSFLSFPALVPEPVTKQNSPTQGTAQSAAVSNPFPGTEHPSSATTPVTPPPAPAQYSSALRALAAPKPAAKGLDSPPDKSSSVAPPPVPSSSVPPSLPSFYSTPGSVVQSTLLSPTSPGAVSVHTTTTTGTARPTGRNALTNTRSESMQTRRVGSALASRRTSVQSAKPGTGLANTNTLASRRRASTTDITTTRTIPAVDIEKRDPTQHLQGRPVFVPNGKLAGISQKKLEMLMRTKEIKIGRVLKGAIDPESGSSASTENSTPGSFARNRLPGILEVIRERHIASPPQALNTYTRDSTPLSANRAPSSSPDHKSSLPPRSPTGLRQSLSRQFIDGISSPGVAIRSDSDATTSPVANTTSTSSLMNSIPFQKALAPIPFFSDESPSSPVTPTTPLPPERSRSPVSPLSPHATAPFASPAKSPSKSPTKSSPFTSTPSSTLSSTLSSSRTSSKADPRFPTGSIPFRRSTTPSTPTPATTTTTTTTTLATTATPGSLHTPAAAAAPVTTPVSRPPLARRVSDSPFASTPPNATTAAASGSKASSRRGSASLSQTPHNPVALRRPSGGLRPAQVLEHVLSDLGVTVDHSAGSTRSRTDPQRASSGSRSRAPNTVTPSFSSIPPQVPPMSIVPELGLTSPKFKVPSVPKPSLESPPESPVPIPNLVNTVSYQGFTASPLNLLCSVLQWSKDGILQFVVKKVQEQELQHKLRVQHAASNDLRNSLQPGKLISDMGIRVGRTDGRTDGPSSGTNTLVLDQSDIQASPGPKSPPDANANTASVEVPPPVFLSIPITTFIAPDNNEEWKQEIEYELKDYFMWLEDVELSNRHNAQIEMEKRRAAEDLDTKVKQLTSETISTIEGELHRLFEEEEEAIQKHLESVRKAQEQAAAVQQQQLQQQDQQQQTVQKQQAVKVIEPPSSSDNFDIYKQGLSSTSSAFESFSNTSRPSLSIPNAFSPNKPSITSGSSAVENVTSSAASAASASESKAREAVASMQSIEEDSMNIYADDTFLDDDDKMSHVLESTEARELKDQPKETPHEASIEVPVDTSKDTEALESSKLVVHLYQPQEPTSSSSELTSQETNLPSSLKSPKKVVQIIEPERATLVSISEHSDNGSLNSPTSAQLPSDGRPELIIPTTPRAKSVPAHNSVWNAVFESDKIITHPVIVPPRTTSRTPRRVVRSGGAKESALQVAERRKRDGQPLRSSSKEIVPLPSVREKVRTDRSNRSKSTPFAPIKTPHPRAASKAAAGQRSVVLAVVSHVRNDASVPPAADKNYRSVEDITRRYDEERSKRRLELDLKLQQSLTRVVQEHETRLKALNEAKRVPPEAPFAPLLLPPLLPPAALIKNSAFGNAPVASPGTASKPSAAPKVAAQQKVSMGERFLTTLRTSTATTARATTKANSSNQVPMNAASRAARATRTADKAAVTAQKTATNRILVGQNTRTAQKTQVAQASQEGPKGANKPDPRDGIGRALLQEILDTPMLSPLATQNNPVNVTVAYLSDPTEGATTAKPKATRNTVAPASTGQKAPTAKPERRSSIVTITNAELSTEGGDADDAESKSARRRSVVLFSVTDDQEAAAAHRRNRAASIVSDAPPLVVDTNKQSVALGQRVGGASRVTSRAASRAASIDYNSFDLDGGHSPYGPEEFGMASCRISEVQIGHILTTGPSIYDTEVVCKDSSSIVASLSTKVPRYNVATSTKTSRSPSNRRGREVERKKAQQVLLQKVYAASVSHYPSLSRFASMLNEVNLASNLIRSYTDELVPILPRDVTSTIAPDLNPTLHSMYTPPLKLLLSSFPPLLPPLVAMRNLLGIGNSLCLNTVYSQDYGNKDAEGFIKLAGKDDKPLTDSYRKQQKRPVKFPLRVLLSIQKVPHNYCAAANKSIKESLSLYDEVTLASNSTLFTSEENDMYILAAALIYCPKGA